MKILLLGSNGFIGRQAAAVLAARADVGTLVLADYDVRTAKRISKKLSPKCTWAMVDAGKAGDLERLLHDFDVVASAVGPASDYERAILAGCAKNGLPVALVGDAKMPDPLRRETHDAFRAAGVPAVAGCGLAPGWTDLLLAHFLTGGTEGARTGGPVPFLFFSPDRFGGYAFFRRLALDRAPAVPPPPGAPEGLWFPASDGTLVGIPAGKAAGRYRLLESTFGKLGAVGTEFFAAFWLWMRNANDAGKDAPAALAGVFVPDAEGGRTATVADPGGKLAGATLAEVALRLVAARERKEKGLLSPAALLGKKEAESIAGSVGAAIRVERVAPRA